jgi:hypothetical protein
LEQIHRTRLADIIERNTTVENLQDNVFFFRAEVRGRVFADANQDGERNRREQGVSGITVELLDDEGQVVATTETNRDGRYRFRDFHETGAYQVQLAGSLEAEPTSSAIVDVQISRGNERLGHVDFGLNLLDQIAEDTAQSRERTPRQPREALVDEFFADENAQNGLSLG